MYRKVCIVGLFALIGSVLSRSPPKDEFSAVELKCIKDLGLDGDNIISVLDFSDDENISSPFWCFLECTERENGLINNDGIVDVDVAMARLGITDSEDPTMRSVISKCAEERGENSCDTFKRTFECLRSQERDYKITV